MHGNDIHDVKHLTILGNFRELLKFSIHGNPLEAEVPEYKWFLLAHVPSLKQLNFTTLSTGDLRQANAYRNQLMRQRREDEEEDWKNVNKLILWCQKFFFVVYKLNIRYGSQNSGLN